jgi:DNA helicase-2/ATP-dependent DNA helicase PcrA
MSEVELKTRGRLLAKISSSILRLGSSWDCNEIARLTIEQLTFINHRLSIPCYLAACPGSGKTEVVGIKTVYELSKWPDLHSGIAVLTFTRNAADAINRRIIGYGGALVSRHPHFVGTFDSWLHGYIFQPFGYRFTKYDGSSGDRRIKIIDDDSSAGFLHSFTAPIPGNHVHVLPTSFFFGVQGEPQTIDSAMESLIMDPNNRVALKCCKKRFWKAGFATYQDAEFISCRILAAYEDISLRIAKRFPVLIVDECQDLSPAQLKLLECLVAKGVTVHMVGDLDQSIYEFRKVDPALITQFADQCKMQPRLLSSNFRSNQSIVDVCCKIIHTGAEVRGNGTSKVVSPAVLYEYDNLESADLPGKFRQLIDALQFDAGQCALLARGKSTLSKITPQNEGKGSPVELFAAALNSFYGLSGKTDDIKDALEQAGRAISYLGFQGKGNHQWYRCPETVDSAIEWRRYLWSLLQRAHGLFPFEEDGNPYTWSTWASKFKGFLAQEWPALPPGATPWTAVQGRIKAPSGSANRLVRDMVHQRTGQSRIRATTIHDAKGETLDAVMLVSSPDKRSKGGHFEHWIDPSPGNEEHRRFAYVACSRPRHLLVIATKRLTATQRASLTALGLVAVTDLSTIAATTGPIFPPGELGRSATQAPARE